MDATRLSVAPGPGHLALRADDRGAQRAGANGVVTPRAVFVRAEDGGRTFVCDVDQAGDASASQRIAFAAEDVLEHNQPHVPPPGAEKLELEDAVTFDRRKPLARAKMCEIALVLEELFVDADFSDPGALEDLQRRAVVRVRRSLDLTSFQRGANGKLSGGNTRDRGRFTSGCAARMPCTAKATVACSSVMFVPR